MSKTLPTSQITEALVQEGLKVDREAGVIRNVRILGRISRNGREYSDKAMDSSAKLSEGVRVNIDHTREKGERKLGDRFGRLVNVKRNGDENRGDLEYVKSHPLAEAVCEMAERMPEQLGLSHVADGRINRRGGKSLVEDVTKMHSVDLVGDPATNKTLFEEIEPVSKKTYADVAKDNKLVASLVEANILDGADEFDENNAKLFESFVGIAEGEQKTTEQLKEEIKAELLEQLKAKPEEKKPESTDLKTLSESVEKLTERLDKSERELAVRSLLESQGLQFAAVDDADRKALIEAEDDAARRSIIESWPPFKRKQRQNYKPVVKVQESETTFKSDPKEFAAACR